MPRTLREILFRLRQETTNFYLFAAQPSLGESFVPPALALPDPAPVVARLRGSAFSAQVEQTARQILEHRLPLFGQFLETGSQIEWRKDYVHNRSTLPSYFRRIPYLDFERAGDHKAIWELNRHQHLVTLAQAWLFTGHKEFAHAIGSQLDSWMDQNPFQRGINWTSALEVAFRALSWIWIWHFAGGAMTSDLRRRFFSALNRHGLHLECNLSVYFSPNTHLLGEAVALHALGVLFPDFPRASHWRKLGREIVLAQMETQVQEDGSHFEHSSHYHVYALDMFLLHHILESAPHPYTEKLQRMAAYLDTLMGPARTLVSMGDDDGGRLFHPYGTRNEFGRATLATCSALFAANEWSWQEEDLAPQAAWWLGEKVFSPRRMSTPPARASRLFEHSGVAAMTAGNVHILVDAGGFGFGGAGHSHSDALSITVQLGPSEVLIDPGTYTYLADPALRNWFRGSAAHNTIRIDHCDQATTMGPFRWGEKPAVRVLDWKSGRQSDYLDAECVNRFRHRRRVLFLKSALLLLVLDEVDGPGGEHPIEQFWHLGSGDMAGRIHLPVQEEAVVSEGGEHGWRSAVYGNRQTASVIQVVRTCSLPAIFATAIDLESPARRATLSLREDANGGWIVGWNGQTPISTNFPREGPPQIDFGETNR